jgi:Uma2 family endonuclease
MEIISHFPYKILLKGEFLVMKPDISEEEFWEMSTEDTNYELLDGVLYIHSPASTEHEEIFKYLLTLFQIYFEINEGGKVFGSRLVMRLSPKWNPEPDLMVVLKTHYNKIQPTKIEGPADLVIEILSNATRDIDLHKKIPQYLDAGVQEVWIIDPQKKSFTQMWIEHKTSKKLSWMYSPDQKSKGGEIEDMSLRSKILPDLKFNPHWIWERDTHPIHKMFL